MTCRRIAAALPLAVALLVGGDDEGRGARRDEGDLVWAATEHCVSAQQDAALRADWLLGSASFRAERRRAAR